MSTHVENLLRQVADLVEPNTRFDLGSLPVEASEVRQYPVFAEETYRVSFSIERRRGKGALPDGTLPVDDESGLATHVERLLAARSRDLAERLRSWAGAQRELPGRPLAERDCHDGPSAAGFTKSCRDCGGDGQTQCTQCHGHCTVTCNQCYGSGHTKCRTCGGTAYQSCSACRGAGYTTQYKQVRRVNYADNREWTESVPEQQSCWQCAGQGKQPCTCGNGQVSCFGCGSSGKIRCNACSGRGSVDCGSCAATGTLHETAWIACTIEHSFDVRAPEAFDEARDALASLESLCALTPVRSGGVDARPDGVTRRFDAPITIATAQLRAAGHTVVVHGYGESARVFDFKNLLGILLESDVAELARHLAATSALPLKPTPDLDSALNRVLLSEVNAAIAQSGARNATAARALSADELRGAVTADYARQTAKTIRTAVARVYRGAMIVPAAIAAVVPTLVVALLHPVIGPGDEILWSMLGAALVAGIGAELVARRRFRKRFEDAAAPKALAVLRATFERWTWRVAMAVAMIICAVAYIAIAVA